jgi:hypothetical protein
MDKPWAATPPISTQISSLHQPYENALGARAISRISAGVDDAMPRRAIEALGSRGARWLSVDRTRQAGAARR